MEQLGLCFSLEAPYTRAAQPDTLSWAREQRAAGRISQSGEEAISSGQAILLGHSAPQRSAPLWKRLQLLQDRFTSSSRRSKSRCSSPIIRRGGKSVQPRGRGSKPSSQHSYLESSPARAWFLGYPYTNLSLTSYLLTNLQELLEYSDVPNTSLPQTLSTSVNELDRCPKRKRKKKRNSGLTAVYLIMFQTKRWK